MAYVQPNSTLQLFKGINLDNRYLHTIYFASEAAQDTWFTSKVTSALTFNNLMYRRYTSQAVKIEIDATKLYGVTYMRFKNTRTNNKWYYAFVLDIDYVNENTAVVYYEIDVMQTWFIQNGSVRPCMVVREHTNDDTFGINMEEEPVGSNVYDSDELTYTVVDEPDLNLFGFYALITNTTENAAVHGQSVINNNLVNGTAFYSKKESDYQTPPNAYRQAIELFLNDLSTKINGSWEQGQKPVEVVDMFTFPEAFADDDADNNKHIVSITHPATLDAYTPKNKKLYGYPFSFLQITTKNGEGCSLKWEYFDGMLETQNTCEFTAYGCAIGGGQVQLYPNDYNGVVENVDAGLTLSNFPKNPFAYSAYDAWVAGGGSNRLHDESVLTNVRGITGIAKSVSNAVSASISGYANWEDASYNPKKSYSSQVAAGVSAINAGIQGIGSVVESIASFKEGRNKINYEFKDASYRPDIVVGKATPSLAVASRYLDFYFLSVHVRKDEITRIDDFLSCFGYATNKVKAPNITGRQYWNFVQTQNAVIAGDMPASSKEAIGRIFDGGITFWHNGDQVGNYSQSVSQGSINNPIVT